MTGDVSGDPVARQARIVAAAFRIKDLGDIGDMIDYLADRADEQWRATTEALRRKDGTS